MVGCGFSVDFVMDFVGLVAASGGYGCSLLDCGGRRIWLCFIVFFKKKKNLRRIKHRKTSEKKLFVLKSFASENILQ
jgi:hypothetical protein